MSQLKSISDGSVRTTAPALLMRTPQGSETLDITVLFDGKREIIVGREPRCGLSVENEFRQPAACEGF